MSMLTRWWIRRYIERRLLGVIWLGRGPVQPGEVMSPIDLELVFRGR